MRSIIKLGIVVMGGLLISCSTEYTELVRSELSSGIRNDSIFLGFEFGDTRKEFYSKAWNLNKETIVRQGPKNRTIQYMLRPADSTRSSIRFLFYPAFDERNRIKEMDLTIDYEAWSPWTKQYKSDSLIFAMRDTLNSWYGGNQFIRVKREEGSNEYLWVKVDGNRRIVIYQSGDREVLGRISDLFNEEVFDKNKL